MIAKLVSVLFWFYGSFFNTVLRSKVLKNQPDNDYYESMILTFTHERIINFECYLDEINPDIPKLLLNHKYFFDDFRKSHWLIPKIGTELLVYALMLEKAQQRFGNTLRYWSGRF